VKKMTEMSVYITITGILICFTTFALIYGATSGVVNVNDRFMNFQSVTGLSSFPVLPSGGSWTDWIVYSLSLIGHIIWMVIGTAIFIITSVVVLIVILFQTFAVLPALFNILFTVPLILVWSYLTMRTIMGS
jgi:hypothetical protein